MQVHHGETKNAKNHEVEIEKGVEIKRVCMIRRCIRDARPPPQMIVENEDEDIHEEIQNEVNVENPMPECAEANACQVANVDFRDLMSVQT